MVRSVVRVWCSAALKSLGVTDDERKAMIARKNGQIRRLAVVYK
jgi:hypothetical protein